MVLRTEFDKVYREHRDGTYTPKKRESKSGQQEQKEPFTIPDGYYSSEQIAVTYQMTKKTICSCAVKTTFLKSVTEGSTTTNSWQ